ncbi:TPA: QVPTGV class sortase B protein-sorting domain-containing protein [Streptococcus pyogenes]
MKKNKLLLATAILATALGTASLNQNVKAETAGVVSSGQLTIKKSITNFNDDTLLMPKTDYTFSVNPDSAATGTESNLPIKPGIAVNNQDIKVSYSNTDKTSGKEKQVVVDFMKVTFPSVGIYRYVVTENKGTAEGVTYDDTKWLVDVYVGNNEKGGLEPKYIVSKKGDSATKEPIQFNNSFETTSLKIEKKVTGNTGDHKKAFNFTLTLQPNEYYEASSVVKIEENGQTKDVKIGEAYKFTLNDSQSVILSKLPVGINYKVEEAEANQGGYTTTATLKDGEKLSTYNLGQEHKTDKTSDEIVVTNKRDTQVPTGVVGTLAPFAVLSIVAIGGVIYITKRKKA